MTFKQIKYLPAVVCLLPAVQANACISCNRQVRNGIYDSMFYPNLLLMLSAFIVLTIIVVLLARISRLRYQARIRLLKDKDLLSPVPLTTAAMVLGIGLGGFMDGIVLHQMLQWHEMLSAKIPPTDYVGKSVNMFWDGIFHFFCLAVVFTGVLLLWKLTGRPDINRSGKLLSGGMLMGWALFNIVEGIIDHHILKLHNVVEYAADHHTGNTIFLGASAVMLLAGYFLVRKADRYNNLHGNPLH